MRSTTKNEIFQERQRWETKLEQELTQSRIRNEQEKQVLFNEAMRRVVDEKEKQIELLREREAALNLECIKYKNTIQQLTDTENDNSSHNSTLMDKMEALQRDKCQLEAELSMERSRRLVETAQDLTASVAGDKSVYYLNIRNLTKYCAIETKFRVLQQFF